MTVNIYVPIASLPVGATYILPSQPDKTWQILDAGNPPYAIPGGKRPVSCLQTGELTYNADGDCLPVNLKAVPA